jgi:hypothetical protein
MKELLVQLGELKVKDKRKYESTLQILNTLHPRIKALNSEEGQAILQRELARHDELWKILYEHNRFASAEEEGEWNYLKKKLIQDALDIDKYNKVAIEVGGN